MKTVFLGIGSNIENRINFINIAIEKISEYLNIIAISTIYESIPWGVKNQSSFLNCVLKAETSLIPEKLLSLVKCIEKEVGRKDRFKWGPREIDIDILLYENEIIDTPVLKIPHPFLCKRDFFLYPLIEIAPDIKYPISGRNISEYASTLENKLTPFCSIIFHLSHIFPSSPR